MNRKLMILFLVFAIGCLTGCAKPVHKDWTASGGSKSDAVVELAFFFTENEKPEYSEDQAKEVALKRCQSWGYADAEPFGTIKTSYQGLDGWFHKHMATMKYQCLGESKSKP